jgi:hypothetical protein
MRNVTNVEDDLDEGGREMGMRLMTMGLGMVEMKRKVREIKDTEIRLFKNMHIDKDQSDQSVTSQVKNLVQKYEGLRSLSLDIS